MRRAAPLLAAALAAAGLWLAIATRAHNPGLEAARPPPVYDYFAYYRPNAAYAFGRLAAGDLPLWNPLQQLGQPLLATLQTGVLYPPNWLHVALPTQQAFAALAFAHLGLAAALAAGLARRLGAGAIGAAAAGLLYAGSLQLWNAVWTPPTLYTAAWLPGVLWAVDRAALRPGPGSAAALAFAVGLQALVGWPYAVAMTALAAAATAAAALVARARATGRLPIAALAALAAGAAGGACLAAPQLLPALELMARSTRALGTLDEATAGLGGPSHDPHRFAATLVGFGASDGVPGLLAPLLALVAVALPGRARVRCAVLLGVGLLALAASFPQHLPVYDALRRLPVLGDFRFPFRYRLLTTLALAVAAGVGVGRAGARLAARRGARAGALLAAGLAAATVACAVVPLARTLGQASAAFPRRAATAADPLAPLVSAVRAAGPASSRSFWRGFGVDKLGQETGLRVVQDLEPLSLGATSRLMTFLARGDAGVDPARRAGVRPTLGAPYFGSIALPGEPGRAPVLDLLAVRFVATIEPPPWLYERYRRISRGGDLVLFENPHALPRAWRAARAAPAPADPQALAERLVAPDFDPRATVFLEPPLPAALEALAVDARGGAAGGETVFEVDAPERIVLRTRGERAAILVLADAWYPGWEARVDGEPAPLLRANLALRAVPVSPGEHRVELRYRPASFRLGLTLAAGAVLAYALFRLGGPGRGDRRR